MADGIEVVDVGPRLGVAGETVGPRLGVESADVGTVPGRPGDPGPGLEYQWSIDGKTLGVRPVGSTGDYDYSADLTGPRGDGDVDTVNGVAPVAGDVTLDWLDIAGTIPTSKIPAAALTIPTVVADEAAMLALDAQQGDVAIRSDTQIAYMLAANGDPTVLADWLAISTPGGVTSVNGQTGVVVLAPANIGAATAAQGAKADTAVQPAAIADVVRAGGSTPIRNTWGVTQAEYDALTPDPNTLYVITDSGA